MTQKPGLSEPAKLIEVPIFFYEVRQQPIFDPVTVALLSSRLDLGFGFREFGQVGGPSFAVNAYPLWCDEVAVSVHLDNETATVMPVSDGSVVGSLSANPTFTATTLRIEALSPTGPMNQTPRYIVANEPEDITATLSAGFGVTRVYTPASRVIRFAVRGSIADASAAVYGNLVIETTARCKNLAPLLAMLEKAWGKQPPHLVDRPLGPGQNGIIRSLVPAC